MLRNFKAEDLCQVMQIWLDSNLQAHAFIPPRYWYENYDSVKEMIPRAEVTVYEKEGQILGFLGGFQGFIEGIFVREDARSAGIGRALLDFAKQSNNSLTLEVYEKNTRAVAFYRREGFRILARNIDPYTKQPAYQMLWEA